VQAAETLEDKPTSSANCLSEPRTLCHYGIPHCGNWKIEVDAKGPGTPPADDSDDRVGHSAKGKARCSTTSETLTSVHLAIVDEAQACFERLKCRAQSFDELGLAQLYAVRSGKDGWSRIEDGHSRSSSESALNGQIRQPVANSGTSTPYRNGSACRKDAFVRTRLGRVWRRAEAHQSGTTHRRQSP